MNLPNTRFTRRAFLGGAGATVALTLAQGAVPSLLPTTVIPAQLILDGQPSLLLLDVALEHPAFAAQSILLISQDLLAPVRAMLRQKRRSLHVRVWNATEREQAGPQAALLLGGFARLRPETRSYTQFTKMLCSRSFLYLDDPTFAARLEKIWSNAPSRSRCMPGLCSSVDPSVDFAVRHVHSGAMGSLRRITTSAKTTDAFSALEAAAIYQRLQGDSWHPEQSAALLPTCPSAEKRPVLSIRGSRGHLQIPLYTARDRRDLLPMRLQHFAEVAQQ